VFFDKFPEWICGEDLITQDFHVASESSLVTPQHEAGANHQIVQRLAARYSARSTELVTIDDTLQHYWTLKVHVSRDVFGCI
jgi:hypothetical protein